MPETSQNNDKKLVERKVTWKGCLEHLKDSTTGRLRKARNKSVSRRVFCSVKPAEQQAQVPALDTR